MSSSLGRKIWQAGTWELRHDLPNDGGNNAAAFSADSRLLAFEDHRGVVRLVDAASGRSLVRLEVPEPQVLLPVAFVQGDTELIALGTESQALHVFDLRALRQELRLWNLDWDAALPPPPILQRPPRIEVVISK